MNHKSHQRMGFDGHCPQCAAEDACKAIVAILIVVAVLLTTVIWMILA
jgi:hypothetical protein